MSLSQPDAVVIGAGPYGLAAASYLEARGVTTRVFGSEMAGWSDHMPRGMFLKSTAADSSIGSPWSGYRLGDFCREMGISPFDAGGGERPIPVEDFIDYGRWFQQSLVPHLERRSVRRIDRVVGGFALLLEDGERLVTRNVVMAAGLVPFAAVPAELRRDGAGTCFTSGLPRVSHSCDHHDLSSFSGRHVAVIGAGQSALETAVLLDEAGARVELIVRGPAVRWAGPPTADRPTVWSKLRRPPAPLGAGWTHLLLTRYADAYRYLPEATRLRLVRTVLGPCGAWWLRSRFTADIRVRPGRSVTRASVHDEGVDLVLEKVDGRFDRLAVDHVIAATGYRVDLGRLEFLSPQITALIATTGGFPLLSTTFESSVPGLFFTGLSAAGTFGPMLRFVAGTDFAARKVSTGVVARVRGAGSTDAQGVLASQEDTAA